MTGAGYRRRQRRKNRRNPYRHYRQRALAGPTADTVLTGRAVHTIRVPEGWEPLGTVAREPTLSWRGRGA